MVPESSTLSMTAFIMSSSSHIFIMSSSSPDPEGRVQGFAAEINCYSGKYLCLHRVQPVETQLVQSH